MKLIRLRRGRVSHFRRDDRPRTLCNRLAVRYTVVTNEDPYPLCLICARKLGFRHAGRSEKKCELCQGERWLPRRYEDRPSGRLWISDPCPHCNPDGTLD